MDKSFEKKYIGGALEGRLDSIGYRTVELEKDFKDYIPELKEILTDVRLVGEDFLFFNIFRPFDKKDEGYIRTICRDKLKEILKKGGFEKDHLEAVSNYESFSAELGEMVLCCIVPHNGNCEDHVNVGLEYLEKIFNS